MYYKNVDNCMLYWSSVDHFFLTSTVFEIGPFLARMVWGFTVLGFPISEGKLFIPRRVTHEPWEISKSGQLMATRLSIFTHFLSWQLFSISSGSKVMASQSWSTKIFSTKWLEFSRGVRINMAGTVSQNGHRFRVWSKRHFAANSMGNLKIK